MKPRRAERRTARQVRDARVDAGLPTLDDALGFPSLLTFRPKGAARAAGRKGELRDALGRSYRRREPDGEAWNFAVPRRRREEDGEPVPLPEPGERLVMTDASEYVVLEVATAVAARRNTGAVLLKKMAQN